MPEIMKYSKNLKNGWRQRLVRNDVILVSLLLTLNIFTPCSSVSVVNFEQVFAG